MDLKNNNLVIIIAAVCVTGAVFLLFEFGQGGFADYLGIAAILGGLLGLTLGYRFLMAYFGRLKSQQEEKLYAELKTYEKPIAKGEITFFFELPEDSTVRFSLMDLNGQILVELLNDKLKAGNYPVKLDTTQVENGTYYYELKTGNQTNSKKLIIDNS